MEETITEYFFNDGSTIRLLINGEDGYKKHRELIKELGKWRAVNGKSPISEGDLVKTTGFTKDYGEVKSIIEPDSPKDEFQIRIKLASSGDVFYFLYQSITKVSQDELLECPVCGGDLWPTKGDRRWSCRNSDCGAEVTDKS